MFNKINITYSEQEEIFTKENKNFLEGIKNGEINTPTDKELDEQNLIQEGLEAFDNRIVQIIRAKKPLPLTNISFTKEKGLFISKKLITN